MPADTVSYTLEDARTAMQDRWGYPSFRAGQAAIIEAVLEGRDVMGILPTGGGKSLCYQVPAVLFDGLTLVISPLIALMQDQVEGLERNGIRAAALNSAMSRRNREQCLVNAEHGLYDVLYVAPERLTTTHFQARAAELNVSLLAVDEAHCVSEWGHHFRPDYKEIAPAREALGDPPMLAVTATATPEVRADVQDLLDLKDPKVVVQGFDRPNLVWSVFQTANKRDKLRDVLNGVPGCGIVYASTRRNVEMWTDWLQNEGVSAAGYHGGMDSRRRTDAQQQWIQDEVRVIVATNAFGMGIDKPDVRFVVHVDLPSSLEAYYQEAGRAGRDGERAYAVLFYQPPDADTQEALIETGHPSVKEIQAVYTGICNVGQIPLGSFPDAPLTVDMKAVQRVTDLHASKIRTAIDMLERAEAWQRLPNRRHRGWIRFRQRASEVRSFARNQSNSALKAFVLDLIRSVHADAYSRWWHLNVKQLERRMDLPRARIFKGLDYLAERGLLEWRKPGRAIHLELLHPRAKQWPVEGEAVAAARERAEDRLAAMISYAESATCRRQQLLAYFGEDSDPCGKCDVCLGRHDPDPVTPRDEDELRTVLQAIAEERPQSEWLSADTPRYRVERLLHWLIQQGYVDPPPPAARTYTLTTKAHRFVPE